ncbi:MAG TPA: DUF6600 domain-containing protein [Pyrinomonadaceae bacterium]|nr:DUF6600 domain-containing protein [Pyrinomonadaceae bacterium]
MRVKSGGARLAIIGVLCAALGAAVAAFWVSRDRKAEEAQVSGAARVERVAGVVGLDRMLEDDGLEDEWQEVTPNTPVSVGDRLYAGEGSRAALAFTGRNFARLGPETSLDVLALSDRRMQLALRDGSAVFEIGELDDDQFYEVATPHGAFELREPGFYEVGLNEDGGAWLSVLNGVARFVGLAGSGDVGKGEVLTLLGQTAADVVLSRLSPDYAGSLLNDYYGDQYPGLYDGRYGSYDAYLADPYHFDPYNRYDSYRYVSDLIPGVRDLDSYGSWQEVDGYGHAWQPRVEDGWAPYQQGYWTLDEPHGMTWVSAEPWGYAPYHYGRWVNSGGQWYWVPEGASERPAYAPALVAFLPPDASGLVGWVPLAPDDTYVRTYYGPDWQPHYLDDADPARLTFTNLDVPGALTAVPAESFWRTVEPRAVASNRPRDAGRARAVLDPFSVGEMRQLALLESKARRGAKLPPGLARKWADTSVYTAEPTAPPAYGRDVARALRAEAVPEKQKKQKLQLADERREAAGESARGRGRDSRGDSRSDEAAAGPPVAAEAPGRERGEGRGARADERTAPHAQPVAGAPVREGGGRLGNPAVRGPQAERVGGRQNAQPAVERPQGQPRGAEARPQPQPRRDEAPRAAPPRQEQRQPAHAHPPQGQGRQKAERPQGGPPAERGNQQGKGQGGGGGKGKGKP